VRKKTAANEKISSQTPLESAERCWWCNRDWKLFHTGAAATRKAWWPMVERQVGRTTQNTAEQCSWANKGQN